MAIETTASEGVDIRIRGLSHFTLPVRDRYVAARFYAAVLNGEVVHELDPEAVRLGRARALFLGVKLCDGIVLDLFEQPYGQPQVEQAHPHHAFDITADDVPVWLERLRYWQVPFVGPITRGSPAIEIYFRDPDGNQLELNCRNYPAELRQALPKGPHDHHKTVIEQWPTPERAAEANALLDAQLARLRASRAH